MRLNHNIVYFMDMVGRLLRTLGLQSFTRICRNFVGKIFPEGVAVKVNGHCLYGSILDRAFLYKVADGCFEPETIRVFLETVKPGMIVLDVGAYLGYYSLLAARQVGPEGKVYAFEPDPLNSYWLEYNIKMSGHFNIVPIKKAISNQRSLIQLYRHPHDASMSSFVNRAGFEPGIKIECVSLDDFLTEKQVDVIKLDVEGMEIKALKGMQRLIKRSHTMTLFVELNPLALSESGSSPEDLLRRIKKLGFNKIIRLDEQRNSIGNLELCNLFCRREYKK